MPARNGQQYIERLRERPPALYLRGEQVKDATVHPGLSGGCAPNPTLSSRLTVAPALRIAYEKAL